MASPLSSRPQGRSNNPLTRSIALHASASSGEKQLPPDREEVVDYNHPLPVIPWNDKQPVQIPLSNGTPDAIQIISVLDNLAWQFGSNPYVRDAAMFIISQDGPFGQDDSVSHANRLIEFVRQRVVYVKDPVFSEYVISPIVMLQEIDQNRTTIGDCDDHVLLLNSLLNSVGIQTKVVGVKLNSADTFDHVISQVYLRNSWQDVDTCVKQGIQPQYTSKITVAAKPQLQPVGQFESGIGEGLGGDFGDLAGAGDLGGFEGFTDFGNVGGAVEATGGGTVGTLSGLGDMDVGFSGFNDLSGDFNYDGPDASSSSLWGAGDMSAYSRGDMAPVPTNQTGGFWDGFDGFLGGLGKTGASIGLSLGLGKVLGSKNASGTMPNTGNVVKSPTAGLQNSFLLPSPIQTLNQGAINTQANTFTPVNNNQNLLIGGVALVALYLLLKK